MSDAGHSTRDPDQQSILRRAATDLEHIRGNERYGLVLVLIVVSFVFLEAAPDNEWSRAIAVALEGATLLLALWTSRVSKRTRMLAVGVVLVALAATAVAILGGSGSLSRLFARAVNLLLVALAPVAIARGVGRSVVQRRQVTLQAIAGVICIYLLVGMFFAFAYGVIAAAGSGTFFASGIDGETADFLYFSFGTLTTVGYGDLTTVNGLARALVIIEALIGQLYLVTVLSLFVSNLRPRRQRADA